MSKKYNDDANGKITFNLSSDNTSPNLFLKSKVPIIIVALVVIIFILLAVIVLGNFQKDTVNNEAPASSQINNNLNNDIIVSTTVSKIGETQPVTTFSEVNEISAMDEIVAIAPIKTISSFSDSVLKISASSQLNDENVGGETHNYSASKAIDNDLSTCWCEGSNDYGVGDYVEIQFNDEYLINELVIWNGLCTSEDLYNKNSRLSKVMITYSDGDTATFDLSDGWNSRQAIFNLTGKKTSSLRITIEGVYQGSKYKDTCISEIYVS